MEKIYLNIGTLTMITVILYSFFRFGKKYFSDATNYMFNTPTSWNKHIDRPRIYLYIIGSVFMFYSYIMLISNLSDTIINETFLRIVFWLLFLMGGSICHFTWTNKFKTAIIPKIQKKLNPSLKLTACFYDDERVYDIYKKFTQEGYLKGTLDSFKSLISLTDLDTNHRIQWIHPIARKPKLTNRQTLMELLSQLFMEFEKLDNKLIILICNQYFCNSNNQDFKITSKNVNDWRENNSPYLKEISDIIKSSNL